MLILGLDVVTLAMGLPVVFVLGTVSMAYLYRQDLPFILLAQRVFVGMDSFVLLAIPCYVLMGNVMSHGLVHGYSGEKGQDNGWSHPRWSCRRDRQRRNHLFPGSPGRGRQMPQPSEAF